MFRFLLMLFLLVPLIEIYVLIQVGDVIGAGWTVFAVVATAIIGVSLLRVQSASILLRAQANMQQGQVPAVEMMEGVALAASGILLLTPGFFTDAFGFMLLLPFLRRMLIKQLLARSQFVMQGQTHYSQHRASTETVIEGEVVTDDEHHLR